MRNTPALAGGREVAIYCKLFSDMVTVRLCTLRRKELDARGGFSCDGCVMKENIAAGVPAYVGRKQTGTVSKHGTLG